MINKRIAFKGTRYRSPQILFYLEGFHNSLKQVFVFVEFKWNSKAYDGVSSVVLSRGIGQVS